MWTVSLPVLYVAAEMRSYGSWKKVKRKGLSATNVHYGKACKDKGFRSANFRQRSFIALKHEEVRVEIRAARN